MHHKHAALSCNVRSTRSQAFWRRSAAANIRDTKLFAMRLDELRIAIHNNQVSFPSQVPVFSKHTRPDLQQKLAQLYFVLGWSGPRIRERYNLNKQRFHQVLTTWTRRAIEMGYIQTIPPAETAAFGSSRYITHTADPVHVPTQIQPAHQPWLSETVDSFA
jgi:hypothetical protein